jgi:murein DD-endopeptidase MepM/ murein hydrolase activator NlpD
MFSGAGAALKDDLAALRAKQTAISNQKKDVQSQIRETSGQIAAVGTTKALLDYEISLTEDEIDNLNAQIDVIEGQITEKEAQYRQTKSAEDATYEVFRSHVRAMEENGDVTYLEILFGARDFADLLWRVDFITEIMTADSRVTDDYVAAQSRTIAVQGELELVRAEVDDYRGQVQLKQLELEGQRHEAELMIRELEENREENQAAFDALEASSSALNKEITNVLAKIAEEERKAREEAARKNQAAQNVIISSGVYKWPSNNTKINSGFGKRQSPTAGGSSNHQGLDIASNQGDNIYAADDGKVVTATYSSSYGNYVVINHGGGRSTLYGHMSKLKCKAGDMVSKGDVIGLVGSTGISTGPHLHFETRVDGVAVDPLRYFS